MSFLYAQYVTEYLLKKGCAIILDYISKSEVKVKTKFFIFIPMSLIKARPCEMVIISLMTSYISGPCALLFFSQYMCKTIYLWLIKPKHIGSFSCIKLDFVPTMYLVCRSQSTATRKRRSLDQNVPTPEVAEKKQVWYISNAKKWWCHQKYCPIFQHCKSLKEISIFFRVAMI